MKEVLLQPGKTKELLVGFPLVNLNVLQADYMTRPSPATHVASPRLSCFLQECSCSRNSLVM